MVTTRRQRKAIPACVPGIPIETYFHICSFIEDVETLINAAIKKVNKSLIILFNKL